MPHFKAYWLPPTTRPPLLGDAQARVIEAAGPAGGAQPATPPQVKVLVQHKRPDNKRELQLIGGYGLWMRELLTSHSNEEFAPVALV